MVYFLIILGLIIAGAYSAYKLIGYESDDTNGGY